MITAPFAIRFELRELKEVLPWGEPGRQSLHWFGLSDGCYCIETAAGQLLRNNDDELESGLSEPWLSYQVARLFEDLLDLWPALAEPVPPDVMERFGRWYEPARHYAAMEGEDEALDYLWERAVSWWLSRQLDFGYLALPPQLDLCRMGDMVEMKWAGTSHWAPPSASLHVPFATVEAAVTGFCDAFLDAMAARVAEIERRGLPQPSCEIDVPQLVREQVRRRDMAREALARRCETNWNELRALLTRLGG